MAMDFSIDLPDNVKKIIDRLEREGFEGYAVGGCVRDAMIGRVPQDWDITTSAAPENVKSFFGHTVDTGIQHGTVTVILGGEGYEVTTYRIDGTYEDCRHPKEVTFTTKLSEDLLRRDFTINAMAYNGTSGLIDLFGGKEDLKNGIVRCVGDAGERFDEDALRILRAFRFAAQLGFVIDEKTGKAAAERTENLRKISAERIRTELNKLLLSKNPDRLFDAMNAGVTKIVLPEFDSIVAGGKNARGIEGVRSGFAMSGMRAVKAVSLIGGPATGSSVSWTEKEMQILKWAALLSEYADTDIFETDESLYTQKHGEKPEDSYDAVSMTEIGEARAAMVHEKVRGVMTRLKFDNETRDAVTHLVECRNLRIVLINDVSVRQFMKKVGPGYCRLLFELQMARTLAKGFVSVNGSADVQSVKLSQNIAKALKLYGAIVERGDCVSVKQLAITGQDLIAAGFERGPEIGDMLEFLLNRVIVDQDLNNRQKLLDLACLNYG